MRGINLRLSPVESVTYFADGQSLLIARMPAWLRARLPGDLLNFLGRRDDFFWSKRKKTDGYLSLGRWEIHKYMWKARVSVLSFLGGRRLVEENLFRGLLPEERLK